MEINNDVLLKIHNYLPFVRLSAYYVNIIFQRYNTDGGILLYYMRTVIYLSPVHVML